jgi:hypothetical protein
MGLAKMLLRENSIETDSWATLSYQFATVVNLCPFWTVQSSFGTSLSLGLFSPVQNSSLQMSNPIFSEIAVYGRLPEFDPFDTTSGEFLFDLPAYSEEILREYRSDEERAEARLRNEVLRKMARSTAVSMAGHLSFLVPRHEQISIETAAKDDAIHFERITLAEEHGRLTLLSTAIQMFRYGWRVCAKQLHYSWILATQCWRTFCIPLHTRGGPVLILPV